MGSAVSLVQAGASVVEMQTAGRWADPKIFAVKALCEDGTGGTGRGGAVPDTEIGSMPIPKRAENAVQGKYESRFSANSPKPLYSVAYAREVIFVWSLARTAAA